MVFSETCVDFQSGAFFTHGNCNIVEAVVNMATLFVNLYVNVVDRSFWSARKF